MKNKLRIVIILILLTGIITSCNMPSMKSDTSDKIQTLTALFVPTSTSIPMEATEPVVIPTDTSVPPTVTEEPTITETSTEIPTETATVTETAVPSATQQPVVIVVPAATATPQVVAVTPIITGPCIRQAEVFDVMPVTSITIDGSFDDWYANQYNVWNVTYGADSWIGLSDTSATFKIAWNPWYLFIGVRVYDERYVQNAETGQDMYLGDSIELLLDADLCGDYTTTSLNNDDFQIGISPGYGGIGGDMEVFKWYPRPAGTISTMVDVASISQDDGYQVEAAIPWTLFGIVPAPGYTYGFALSVSDNDDNDENLQESLVTCVATRKLTIPTTWGTMILR